jgi:hypothetical protein
VGAASGELLDDLAGGTAVGAEFGHLALLPVGQIKACGKAGGGEVEQGGFALAVDVGDRRGDRVDVVDVDGHRASFRHAK